MTALSFTNAMTLLGLGVKMLDQTKKFRDSNSPNLAAMRAAVQAANEGERIDDVLLQTRGLLDSINGRLEPSSVQSFLAPFLDEVSLAIEKPLSGYEEQLRDLRDYMTANAKTVKTRAMSVGSVTAGGSNVGTGIAKCLSLDILGNQIQSSRADAPTILCTNAQGSAGSTGAGKRNNELFSYRGANAPGGSGLILPIAAAWDSEANLQNSRFAGFTGTKPTAGSPVTPAAVGAFNGWTMSATTNFRCGLDFAARYPAGGASTAYHLSFVGNGTITQNLAQRGASFNPRTPYLPAALIYREGTSDLDITLTWGSKSQTFQLDGGSFGDGAYTWAVVDIDKDLYAKNWWSDSANFAITGANWSTGKAHIIQSGLFSPVAINGLWYWILGGATPFQVGDLFAQTITQSSDGINQRWLTAEAQVSSGIVLPYSGMPTNDDAS